MRRKHNFMLKNKISPNVRTPLPLYNLRIYMKNNKLPILLRDIQDNMSK